VGLRYFNPHSIRKTLVRLFMDIYPVSEQLKAWSQNLGRGADDAAQLWGGIGHAAGPDPARNGGTISLLATVSDELMSFIAWRPQAH